MIGSSIFDTTCFTSYDFSSSDIYIIKTLWNKTYVDILEQDCKKTLFKFGAKNIHSFTAVGSVELIYTLRKVYQNVIKQNTSKSSILIALGVVIKGDTPHFDFVCKYVTEGILQLNLSLDTPTIYGILTVNTIEQLKGRIYGTEKYSSKGEEFALTALQTILNITQLKADK